MNRPREPRLQGYQCPLTYLTRSSPCISSVEFPVLTQNTGRCFSFALAGGYPKEGFGEGRT